MLFGTRSSSKGFFEPFSTSPTVRSSSFSSCARAISSVLFVVQPPPSVVTIGFGGWCFVPDNHMMHAWLGSGDAHQEHHDQNHHEGPHEQQHHPPLTAGTAAPPPPRGDSLAQAVIEILQELLDTLRQGRDKRLCCVRYLWGNDIEQRMRREYRGFYNN